jgi:hypothetical protein
MKIPQYPTANGVSERNSTTFGGVPKFYKFHVSKIFPGKFSNKMPGFMEIGATV